MYRSLWIGSVAMALLCATVAQADDAKDGPRVRITADGQQVEVPGGAVAVAVGSTTAARPSDYWLGVYCRAADDTLRAQLGLDEDQGLVVDRVAPDSPAAKAEIAQHDVLVKADDKPLGSVADLIEVLDKAKEKELTIEVIHQGKKKTTKVTSAKRPEQLRTDFDVEVFPGGGDRWKIEEWFKEFKPDDLLKRGPMQFRFFHPGTILPPGAPVHPPLPGNMSVTIAKQGDKPAKITVKKDDQQWEVTEKELDKLPKDVRPHVERMLGRMPRIPTGRIQRFDFGPGRNIPGRPRIEIQEDLEMDRHKGRLDKQIEEMNRRIEQLRKSIEQLQENRLQPDEAPEE